MCAQTFMYDLIGAMSAVGIQTPRMDDLPEIVFHDSRRSFPGETLKQAVDAAADFFKAAPKIIFVLLPDTGRLPPPLQQFPSTHETDSVSGLGTGMQCDTHCCSASASAPQG